MRFSKLISTLSDELWHRLKQQTDRALGANDPKDYAYFKFIYLNSVVTASPVLTEYHLEVDWTISGLELQKKIIDFLGDQPRPLPVNITFAGRRLKENETLADIGATYADKIYFNIGEPQGGSSGPAGSEAWSRYFNDLSKQIRQNPVLYEEIVDVVCEQIKEEKLLSKWEESDWKLLLLLRNMLGTYANSAPSNSILRVTQQLNATLDTAIEQNDAGTIYHICNVLEWLAYLKPRMFEGFDLAAGMAARSNLATSLLSVLEPQRNLPGRVRMEAAWAVGWASVASRDFGRLVYRRLVELTEHEKAAKLSPIVLTLRCAALRSLLYPTPYMQAALSQNAGWFQASIQDQQEFRRVAFIDDHNEAVKHLHSELIKDLPDIANFQS